MIHNSSSSQMFTRDRRRSVQQHKSTRGGEGKSLVLSFLKENSPAAFVNSVQYSGPECNAMCPGNNVPLPPLPKEGSTRYPSPVPHTPLRISTRTTLQPVAVYWTVSTVRLTDPRSRKSQLFGSGGGNDARCWDRCYRQLRLLVLLLAVQRVFSR